MSPEFWNAVLSAPDDEIDGIMERLEAYKCREDERRRQELHAEILQLIEASR